MSATACTVNGVYGKKNDTANLQDNVNAKSANVNATKEVKSLIIECLFLTVTNVAFDNTAIEQWSTKLDNARKSFPSIDETEMQTLWTDDEDIRSLKSLILFGLKGMAAYAYHAASLGFHSDEVDDFFIKALASITETKRFHNFCCWLS